MTKKQSSAAMRDSLNAPIDRHSVVTPAAILYEHCDGRRAVVSHPQAAGFAVGDPSWHRAGPVDIVLLDAAGTSVSDAENWAFDRLSTRQVEMALAQIAIEADVLLNFATYAAQQQGSGSEAAYNMHMVKMAVGRIGAMVAMAAPGGFHQSAADWLFGDRFGAAAVQTRAGEGSPV